MRAVFGLVLIMGLGLAGFAVYMVQGHFSAQSAALARERAVVAAQVPTVDVYAVNRTINYGEALTPADVVIIQYAEPFLPEGVFLTEADLFPEGNAEPRFVLRQMDANEPVLAAKITQPGEDAGITSRLTRGMRAFTISVDVASGVSGFLRPGDKVDVYWSGTVNSDNGGRGVTQLIQAGVALVAVDQTADGSMNGAMIARTVTVEVTPQQVATLAQAQSTGSLSLSLVGSSDDTIAEATEVDQETLLGIQDEVVVQAEQAQVCTSRERRGAEVVEIPIPCTN